MSNKLTYVIAGLLLATMAFVTVSSLKDESLTMDELAHLPAGYSYLTQADMRINPEHPPLVKDLSAIPLLTFSKIKFPSQISAWKTDVNGQWIFGNNFLFKSGNPADAIIFWARIPMICLLIILGFFIFLWSRELFGNEGALLATFLFSFSPTFLGHGRLVTTDVGAALGVVLATYYLFKYLKNPNKKTLLFAGIAFGIAELLKFSLILLIPFFGIVVLGWIFLKSEKAKHILKNFLRYVGGSILIGIVGLLVIWVVYIFHTWNYPPEKQLSDTQFILASSGLKPVKDIIIWMSDKPVLKAISYYALGLMMIFQRASGGNTGFFMGEISAGGWKAYFPVVYLVKEAVTLHLFTLISILFLVWSSIRSNWLKRPIARFWSWVRFRFIEISMAIFVAIYWITSLRANLNIGVRHLLPAFPFTIILVAGITMIWVKKESKFKKLKLGFLAIMLLWQVISVGANYPYLLTYFNEFVGGPSQGYKYAVDSNLDWGQDLKRLNMWLEKNNINKIYLNYFGGSDTTYYLGDKYIEWNGVNLPSKLPSGSYLAVSATLLQGGRGVPAKGYTELTGYYNWLNDYKPVTVIGNSIFVYKID